MCALLLGLQGGLPVASCEAENPAVPPFDGQGEEGASGATAVPPGMPALPAGAQIIADPSEIEELLKGRKR